MATLDLKKLKNYRAGTFRLRPARKVTTPAEALEYVNERGFIFFWPISGVDLPSLWTAVAGERPVADKHDDPGHITWGWKDEALGKHHWYYAKVLRHKATFISLEIAPYFYALSENYGSPEEDYIISYDEGHLTLAARQIYETLLDKGSLDTISLRKAAHLLNAKESAFNRAMEDLQMDFKIMPVGIAEAGAWKYSYRYDLTSRHFPELLEKARLIQEAEARQKIIKLTIDSVGAAQERDIVKLFGWKPELVKRAIKSLIGNQKLAEGEFPGKVGAWLALPEFLS
jgi:uncharacterized protein YcaQ